MSEQQSQAATTTTASQDQPDDSEPSPERQAELQAAYKANVAAGKPPYAGVSIRTRGEVNWIVRERGWQAEGMTGREGSIENAEQFIDLRNASFINANVSSVNLAFADLRGATMGKGSTFASAYLRNANLSGAFITGSNLSGANLGLCNLSGALIAEANFSGASLRGANLSGAFIPGSDLSGADLAAANLSGTFITASGQLVRGVNANLSGADLRQARMDSATLLGETDLPGAIQLDSTTRLIDVAWNGAILVNIPWEQISRLGDEAAIEAVKTRRERVQALRDAARAYRGLAKALQAQGLTIPALKYRAREQQLERTAQLHSFALGPWLFSWLLNIVSGYGDKPGRALACYLAAVGAFTATYWAMTNQVFGFIHSHSAHLAWYEALVLSISSFHGRGFFPSTLSLGDPIAVVAAAEAIIGLFIELVFIATFTQRFFAR